MAFVALLRRWGLLVLGLIGMIVGVVLLTRPAPASFGWTAYAPLSNTVYVPPVVGSTFFPGVVLALVGLAVTAGWVGFALGRRTTKRGIPD